MEAILEQLLKASAEECEAQLKLECLPNDCSKKERDEARQVWHNNMARVCHWVMRLRQNHEQNLSQVS